MPLYTLQTLVNGVLTNTTYTLNITGSASSNVNVKYSTSNSGPWTDFGGTATYVAEDGEGTPSAPQDGDSLTLSGTIDTYTLSGTCTYEAGDGYVRGGGLAADEADWAASGN